MNFLITCPDHDDATYFVSEYSIELIKFAKEKGFNVINCYEKNATKARVKNFIETKNPEFIMFNGHGNDDIITGQVFEPIIRLEDSDLIKDRIVYARVCHTARTLGKKCAETGTGAYIGFTDRFRIWISNNYSHLPLEDPYAQLIIPPSNVIAKSLLKGNTVEEATNHGKDAYRKNIELLEKSDSKKELRFLLPVLYWNRAKLLAQGNTNATLAQHN